MEVAIIGQGSRFEAVKEAPFLKNALIFETSRTSFCFEGGEYNEESIFSLCLQHKINFVIISGHNRKLKMDWSKLNAVGLHGGKVPEYRGASVINWQILNNEKVITLSVLKFSKEYDTGNILLTCEIPIDFIVLDQVRAKIDQKFCSMVKKIMQDKIFLESGTKQSGRAKLWQKRRPEESQFNFAGVSIDHIKLLLRASENGYRPYFKYKGIIYEIHCIGPAVHYSYTNQPDKIICDGTEHVMFKNGVGYKANLTIREKL